MTHTVPRRPGRQVVASALLGRDDEVARLIALLPSPDTRLVTLTGPVGVGKSRLASSVVASLEGMLPVAVVDLAGTPARELAADAVVRALPGGPGLATSPGEALWERLGGQRVVLVLDDVDEVPDVAALVADLLEIYPAATVLAVGLRPLGLPGEQRLRLGPLPVRAPDATGPAGATGAAGTGGVDVPAGEGVGADHARAGGVDVPAGEGDVADLLDDEPAVALFVARALLADPRFVLDPPTVHAVRRICADVGGLPLAIELAATRVATLPPRLIADQIALLGPAALSRDDLGDGGTREVQDGLDAREGLGDSADRDHVIGASARHGGMTAALTWTTSMLGGQTDEVLRRLSVFHTPFTLGSAQEVCGDGLRGAELLDRLSDLVDVHLLDMRLDDDEPRFRMSPLVRRFAHDQLLESGEEASARAAHAALFQARCRRPGGVPPAQWADVAAALDYSVHTGRSDTALSAAVAEAAVLAGSPGATAELLPLVEQIMAEDGEADPAVRARALLWAAMSSPRDGAHMAAFGAVTAQRLATATSLARESGDDAALLEALDLTVRSIPVTFDVPGGVAAAAEGLALARRSGDETALARFETWSALATLQTGDVAAGTALAVSGLRHAVDVGEPAVVVQAALLLHRLPPEARAALPVTVPDLDELLDVCTEHGLRGPAMLVLGAVAREKLREGDPRAATDAVARHLVLAADSHRTEPLASIPPMALLVVCAARLGAIDDAVAVRAGIGPLESLLPAVLPPDLQAVYAATVAELPPVADAAPDAAPLTVVAANRAAQATARRLAAQAMPTAPAGPAAVDLPPGPAYGDADREPTSLTPRELEVLEEMARGLRNREIADRLGMSTKTAMHHTVAIYRKLGVRGRAEAVALAVRTGLVDPH